MKYKNFVKEAGRSFITLNRKLNQLRYLLRDASHTAREDASSAKHDLQSSELEDFFNGVQNDLNKLYKELQFPKLEHIDEDVAKNVADVFHKYTLGLENLNNFKHDDIEEFEKLLTEKISPNEFDTLLEEFDTHAELKRFNLTARLTTIYNLTTDVENYIRQMLKIFSDAKELDIPPNPTPLSDPRSKETVIVGKPKSVIAKYWKYTDIIKF